MYRLKDTNSLKIEVSSRCALQIVILRAGSVNIREKGLQDEKYH